MYGVGQFEHPDGHGGILQDDLGQFGEGTVQFIGHIHDSLHRPAEYRQVMAFQFFDPAVQADGRLFLIFHVIPCNYPAEPRHR